MSRQHANLDVLELNFHWAAAVDLYCDQPVAGDVGNFLAVDDGGDAVEVERDPVSHGAENILPRQSRSAQILTADSVQQQPIAAPGDQRSTTKFTEIHGKENPNQLPLSVSFGVFSSYPFVMMFLAWVIVVPIVFLEGRHCLARCLDQHLLLRGRIRSPLGKIGDGYSLGEPLSHSVCQAPFRRATALLIGPTSKGPSLPSEWLAPDQDLSCRQ